MFIPPKSDVCIKELFRNETVLRYFVSAVLAVPPESICTIRMRSEEHTSELQSQR